MKVNALEKSQPLQVGNFISENPQQTLFSYLNYYPNSKEKRAIRKHFKIRKGEREIE